MSEDTGNGRGSGYDPWPPHLQRIGILVKDIGLPGTLALAAMALVYVLVRQSPLQAKAWHEVAISVQKATDALSSQTHLLERLSNQIDDHRRESELRRSPETVPPR